MKIGRFCSSGSHIRNEVGIHPTSIIVSTHPAFFSKEKAAGFTFCSRQKFNEHKYVEGSYRVDIGNDVWIGDNVTILEGIKIGDGVIIGAGSLVNKNIEPYSINAGIPVCFIRYRFCQKEIDFLLDFRWWEHGFEWIKENFDIFEHIDLFIKCSQK